MGNLKEGGFITGLIFSLADRWAYNRRGLQAAFYHIVVTNYQLTIISITNRQP